MASRLAAAATSTLARFRLKPDWQYLIHEKFMGSKKKQKKARKKKSNLNIKKVSLPQLINQKNRQIQ